MTHTLTDPVHTLGVLPSARRLRTALRANVAFSLVSGVALLVGGALVAGPWGLGPSWLPPLVGISLLPFAAIVARISVLPATALRKPTRYVVAADIAWVVASIVVLAAASLPPAGFTLVGLVAGMVGAIAGWQLLGLTALDEEDLLGEVEVIETSRVLAGPPEDIWPLITDHALYGRLAPNLSQVEVIHAPDEPLRRRCTSTTGRAWEETCTLWEEHHRYAVEVDTSDYPYPLAVMRGLWQVDPDPAGSRVTMRFIYQAEPTVRGGLFSVVFRPLFPPILARIFRGWRDQLTSRSNLVRRF